MRRSDQPPSWRIVKGLQSKLRKGDRLWDIDPRAARELATRLPNASNDVEARALIDLYGAKIDKDLQAKQIEADRARAQRHADGERKKKTALIKAGKRRTIELAKENRLSKSGGGKPTKGSVKAFVAGHRALEKALADRQPGQLTPAPQEAAFEQLYAEAHVRLRVPANTFRDPYALARDLARDARTLNELEVALFLVSRVHPFGVLFEKFMRDAYVPRFNLLFTELRRCEECWRTFVPTDSRDKFCNETCAARSRNRGRAKQGNGKSAAANVMARAEAKLKKHMDSCATCKIGKLCATRESALQSMDAMAHWEGMSPEDAEAIVLSGRRKPKRGSAER